MTPNDGQSKPILYVMVCNHFDPTWRRAFERPLVNRGKTYVSYADLEAYYIDDNLAMADARPDYAFHVESPLVLRTYLKRRPERLGKLRALAQEGRLFVPGTGDNIVDANLAGGETIVRNLVRGILWVEETLGLPTRQGYRHDAFGQSAQLPQMYRGVEIEHVIHYVYSLPEGRYWRGIDGSTVLHGYIPLVGEAGHYAKYPPCPACAGTGTRGAAAAVCDTCRGRGIDHAAAEAKWRRLAVDEAKLREAGVGYAFLGSEELLPQWSTFEDVDRLRATYDVRFASFEEPMKHLEDELARVDSPDALPLHGGVELNPNNTGCYVTRIKTKQELRRQEFGLLRAESLALLAHLRGGDYPVALLDAAWDDLLFTAFHDAVTGTHVDAGYEELQAYWERIDEATLQVLDGAAAQLREGESDPLAFTALNVTGGAVTDTVAVSLPAGDGAELPIVGRTSAESGHLRYELLVRDVSAYGAVVFEARAVEREEAEPIGATGPEPIDGRADGLYAIENERYRITADDRGLLTIYDKKLGCPIADALGGLRPGEMVLERDDGSPWATLSPDRPRVPLASATRLKSVEKGEGRERLTYTIRSDDIAYRGYSIDYLELIYSVTLRRGVERVEFAAEADWDTYSHRLRVAMPVPFAGRQLYEIPYAFLERASYEPVYAWDGSNGDWPAINWAGVDGGNVSAALLNKGIPSYAIEETAWGGSLLLLSLLRSPCIPTYLHEPSSYSMTEWDGMRDAGRHAFEYALIGYAGVLAASSVVADAEGYNAGLALAHGRVRLPKAPAVTAGSARIAALKLSEDGRAVVARIVETGGLSGQETVVALPEYVRRAQTVNLLERRGAELPIRDGEVRLTLRPFEIATLRLALSAH